MLSAEEAARAFFYKYSFSRYTVEKAKVVAASWGTELRYKDALKRGCFCPADE